MSRQEPKVELRSRKSQQAEGLCLDNAHYATSSTSRQHMQQQNITNLCPQDGTNLLNWGPEQKTMKNPLNPSLCSIKTSSSLSMSHQDIIKPLYAPSRHHQASLCPIKTSSSLSMSHQDIIKTSSSLSVSHQDIIKPLYVPSRHHQASLCPIKTSSSLSMSHQDIIKALIRSDRFYLHIPHPLSQRS